MLKEFAVDPRVIASSFETCRYLVSQFGAHKGRLISRFPKAWKRLAYDAAHHLPDGRKKKQVVEYLNSIGNEWLMLASTVRAYEAPGEPWVSNAIRAHQTQPFHAIVTDRDDPPNRLLDVDSLDETTPLFAAANAGVVSREAADLAQAATLILQNCRQLRLADPYVNPGRPKWMRPLAAMLALVPDISKVACEYHLLDRDSSPPTEELVRRLEHLKEIIPPGGRLKIIRWRERDGGERFHRRYLLTENAGLAYEGGLDEEAFAKHTTDVFLLDRQLHDRRWSEYNLDAEIYELVKPVLAVDSGGTVIELDT